MVILSVPAAGGLTRSPFLKYPTANLSSMMMRIGGKEVGSSSGTWLDVMNPAIGERLDRVPAGERDDVDATVVAAEGALEAWAAKPPRERGKILFHAAEAVRGRTG